MMLPEELQAEAQLRAVQINPQNLMPPAAPGTPPAALKLALARKKLWPNGHTLRIRFDWKGSKYATQPAAQQIIERRVKEFAGQWLEFANLHFDYGNYPDATIRITFNPNVGSWSYIGTDNLSIPANQPTMNLGWLTPTSSNETYSQVVLHEFGHVIGCIHEHSTEIAQIKWKKDLVYQWYKDNCGWDKPKVDWNVFYIEASSNHSDKFDAESIMTYPILKEHTEDGFHVEWRSQLSKEDKEFIAKIYPKGQSSSLTNVRGSASDRYGKIELCWYHK